MGARQPEPWQVAWRDGFAKVLPVAGLAALRDLLRSGDPLRVLSQGETVFPYATHSGDWPPESACVVGYCGWKGHGLATAGAVQEYFVRAVLEADTLLGGGDGSRACDGTRAFLVWFDETPRGEMIPALLAEVEATLASRGVAA